MTEALPPLSEAARVETTWIHYGAGILHTWNHATPMARGVFRAPHHTVSANGLLGSNDLVRKVDPKTFRPTEDTYRRLRPGEVSLAHNGCLVLDELPEFRQSCIDSLGHALRWGTIHGIPACPALVLATSTLCPCGRLGGPSACTCKPDAIARWTDRLLRLCDLLGVTEIVPVAYPSVGEMAVSR
jgi:magnesium chelatase family protein